MPALKPKVDEEAVHRLQEVAMERLYSEHNSAPTICQYLAEMYQLSKKESMRNTLAGSMQVVLSRNCYTKSLL